MTDPVSPSYPPAARDLSSVVPDTTALKALAHPVRLEMLGLLRLEGPSTASRLAARLGLNSGATSYHLRQLALHGFIAEAGDLGTARDRWWRARHDLTTFGGEDVEGPALEAESAFVQAALTAQVRQMQRAVEQYQSLSPAWRKASTASDLTIPLTAEAAADVVARLEAMVVDLARRAPPLGTDLPADLRPFTIMIHAFPHPRIDAAADEV